MTCQHYDSVISDIIIVSLCTYYILQHISHKSRQIYFFNNRILQIIINWPLINITHLIFTTNHSNLKRIKDMDSTYQIKMWWTNPTRDLQPSLCWNTYRKWQHLNKIKKKKKKNGRVTNNGEKCNFAPPVLTEVRINSSYFFWE